MPVYEFYCSDCHKIYQFFARTAATDKVPDCPVCGKKKLSREISNFAIISQSNNQMSGIEGNDDINENLIVDALMNLADKSSELEQADICDDKKTAKAVEVFKSFIKESKIKTDGRIEDALLRATGMKTEGEIAAELEDSLDAEDYQLALEQLKNYKRCLSRPQTDDKLYDL